MGMLFGKCLFKTSVQFLWGRLGVFVITLWKSVHILDEIFCDCLGHKENLVPVA